MCLGGWWSICLFNAPLFSEDFKVESTGLGAVCCQEGTVEEADRAGKGIENKEGETALQMSIRGGRNEGRQEERAI